MKATFGTDGKENQWVNWQTHIIWKLAIENTCICASESKKKTLN